MTPSPATSGILLGTVADRRRTELPQDTSGAATRARPTGRTITVGGLPEPLWPFVDTVTSTDVPPELTQLLPLYTAPQSSAVCANGLPISDATWRCQTDIVCPILSSVSAQSAAADFFDGASCFAMRPW